MGGKTSRREEEGTQVKRTSGEIKMAKITMRWEVDRDLFKIRVGNRKSS